MKEFEVENYYDEDLKGLINSAEYEREMNRLKAEKAAKEKYEADEIIKADLAEKEKLNKAREEESRQKQLAERQARIDAEKQAIKDEEAERKRLQEKRDELAGQFGSLEVEQMVDLLNDGDDMQPFFEEMVKDAFIDYQNGKLKEEFDKIKSFDNKGNTEETLKQADILFRVVFSDLSRLEKPYLVMLKNGDVPTDPQEMDDMIISNFIVNDMNTDERIRDALKGKELTERQLRQYEKLYILDKIKDVFTKVEVKIDDINDEMKKDDPKYNETLEKGKEEAFSKAFDNLKYRTFTTVKTPDDKIQVIRPADDFLKKNLARKRWLAARPEKPGVVYNHEDLAFQLDFAKGVGDLLCEEYGIPKTVFDKDNKNRIPSSLNRKKYELREIRSVFGRKAMETNISELKTFNEDMAFLCDYEAGDFRKLLRERPHIAKLIDIIKEGPLLHTSDDSKQEEIYENMRKLDPDLVRQYLSFCHHVTMLVKVEYDRQKNELEGWTEEKEKKFTDDYAKAVDWLTNYTDKITNGNISYLDAYSANNKMRQLIKPANGYGMTDAARIIQYEVGALARGWNPRDTFIFAVIGAMQQHARTVYANDRNNKKYEAISNELYKLNWDLYDAKTAIQKRDVIERFDAFVRRNADDKELLAPLSNSQLQYDRTRGAFDADYKNAVIADLKKLENDPAKLAKSMIEMQKIALQREEDFHDEIFKEFITGLTPKAQETLQKALYTERMEQMVLRGKNTYKDQEEIFKRKELANFKYNKVIYDELFSQIGLILGQKDGVASTDRLMKAFPNPISEEVKQDIRQKKLDDLEEKADRILGEVVHDSDYYNFMSADSMDKAKGTTGIHIVTAPEGGYNIKYDKDIVEIKKDIYQRIDAQVDDLSLELARIRTDMNIFAFTIENGDFKNVSTADSLYKAMSDIAHFEKTSVYNYRDQLRTIKRHLKSTINDGNRRGFNEGEAEFYAKLDKYIDKAQEKIDLKHYPDILANHIIEEYKNETEVARHLWMSKDPGNVWKAEPTEEIRQKEENPVDKKLDSYNRALSSIAKNRELEYDKSYELRLFFKPSKIIEMCNKCLDALIAIDGFNISKEAEEYQDFYLALMDCRDAFKAKEIDPNDGSNRTRDALHELDRATRAYLGCNDKSKNAMYRRNVADIVMKQYITHPNGFDIKHNIDDFDDWVERDKDVNKAINNLSKEAADKRKARLDAEKKAADAEKNKNREKDQKDREYDKALQKLNNKQSEAEAALKRAQDAVKEKQHDIDVQHTNINWAKNRGESQERFKTNLAKFENEMVGLKKTLADLEKKAKVEIPAERKKLFDTRKKELDDIKKAEDNKKKLEEEARRKRREERLNPNKKKAEAPKKEDKKVEAPKAAPKKEEKKVEVPKAAAPKKEEKKAAAPKKEEKKAAAPKKEEKKAENKVAPKQEDKKDEPKIIEIPEEIPVNENDEIININDKNDDNIIIPKDKADKAVDKSGKPNEYDRYISGHTGEKMGSTKEKMVDNLAKIYAAHLLKRGNNKFSVSKIHLYMNSMKDNLVLAELSQEELQNCLETPEKAINKVESIRKELYSIKPVDYEAYCSDMKKLLNNMKDSKGRSPEYKDLVRCVERAANLQNKEFGDEFSKETAYTQSAFLLSFAITNYTKGKKSVRTFEGGRERFDNALDAASILTKYAEGSNKRIGQIVNRINKVRNAEKNKDDAVDLNKYGAQRAQEHKKAKEDAKAKPKKEEPKNQMKK